MRLRRGLPGLTSPAILPCTSRPVPAPEGRALAIGSFDGLHLGHQGVLSSLVSHAHSRGLLPSVVSFYPHPRQYFQGGRSPGRILPLRDRLQTLGQLGLEEVIDLRFDHRLASLSAEEFIHRVLVEGLKARWVHVGEDFRFGKGRTGDVQTLADLGGQLGFGVSAASLVASADRDRVSSSRVREALSAGRLDLVRSLLGRPYQLSGRVIHGQKLGRTLGIPTLNLRMPEDLLVQGIFAAWVHGLEKHPLPAVVSLGRRPVVESAGRLLLEAHLLDWAGDAYGRLVSVELTDYLRAEAHYDGLDAMMAQIHLDIAQARQCLGLPPSPAL